MSENEKPLPKPPKTPFGKARMSEGEAAAQPPLMADQMAMAAATGNLDEYMKENLPDNEHARRLAMMMMGMTGMMPQSGFPGMGAESPEIKSDAPAENSEVPEDVKMAIMSGNIEALKGMLMREHARRTGSSIVEEAPPSPPAEAGIAPSGIEKEVLDELIRIASANSVTLDWLIMRALRVYIDDYKKGGRL